jgi:Lrp/AsnC family transcriptional regulator, leucine-responsive regulatory protein
MDEIDRRLVAALAQDGRASWQQLGAIVGLSPNTVAERVRRLVAAGVIRGFHASVNQRALGRNLKVLIDLTIRDEASRADFEAAMATHAQVLSASHVTGQYDYQLVVVAADTDELQSFIDLLKSRLGIRLTNTRLVLKDLR